MIIGCIKRNLELSRVFKNWKLKAKLEFLVNKPKLSAKVDEDSFVENGKFRQMNMIIDTHHEIVTKDFGEANNGVPYFTLRMNNFVSWHNCCSNVFRHWVKFRLN